MCPLRHGAGYTKGPMAAKGAPLKYIAIYTQPRNYSYLTIHSNTDRDTQTEKVGDRNR